MIYCYQNEPGMDFREKSAIHYGTAILSLENPFTLKGEYYTDRNTTGSMYFVEKIR